MSESLKIGIIICDRYRTCAGGKCFRSFVKREGAFKIYEGKNVEIAGFTTCGGCPGGNIENAPEEMKANGIKIIHFATGLVVGYPPCPYISYFKKFIETKYEMEVVIGTHPIPEKYIAPHSNLQSWKDPEWEDLLAPTLCDEKMRKEYD